jgi:hypothetical protein
VIRESHEGEVEMKFLTIVRVRGSAVPPTPEMLRAAKDWVDRKRSDGTFETAYAFATGGGVSIGEADSAEQLMTDFREYPLSMMVDYEIHPLVDLDYSFDDMIERLELLQAQTS